LIQLDFSAVKEHLTNGILSDIWENILRSFRCPIQINLTNRTVVTATTPLSRGCRPASPPAGNGPIPTGPDVDGAPHRKVVRDTSGQEAWNFYYNMYRPDGSLAEQVVFNRDRSRIISEYNDTGSAGDWDERHTVITPDGNKFTFENRGDNQIAYVGGDGRPSETASTEHGSEERPIVQKAFLPAVAAPVVIGAGEGIAIAAAGLALLAWVSRRNSRKGTYALSFPPDVLQRDMPAELRRVQLAPLTEEELKDVCPQHEKVQTFTDQAAAAARLEPRDWTPSGFGTEVHKRVAHRVNGDPPEFSPDRPKNHSFRAEFSTLKAEAAAKADQNARPPGYGDPNTIRVDVLEKTKKRTVCVYDIKTGERVLYWPRIVEIVRSVHARFGPVARIIIAEVRPAR
jgi:hypothetical protein